MAEHGDTGKTLAEHLGISETTFSMKLNSKGGADFNHKEITLIVNKYKLDPNKIASIFFENKVSNIDTKRKK